MVARSGTIWSPPTAPRRRCTKSVVAGPTPPVSKPLTCAATTLWSAAAVSSHNRYTYSSAATGAETGDQVEPLLTPSQLVLARRGGGDHGRARSALAIVTAAWLVTATAAWISPSMMPPSSSNAAKAVGQSRPGLRSLVDPALRDQERGGGAASPPRDVSGDSARHPYDG